MIAFIILFIFGLWIIIISKTSILLIIGIIITMTSVFPFGCFIGWLNDIDDTSPRLSFKQFITLYNTEPSKWNLDSIRGVEYRNDIRVYFNSWIDYIRFQRFKGKIKKRKLKQTQLENQKELIMALQKDLNGHWEEIKDDCKRASL